MARWLVSKPVAGGFRLASWRVFWIPGASLAQGVRPRLLAGWADLANREESVGIRPGDPIFLAPDRRVDARLSTYAQTRIFRGYTAETRRNHVTDLRLFLTFLWAKKVGWWEATRDDVEDYEHWRRFAEHNPRRIGGAKWDRELSALASFYAWASEHRHVPRSPVAMKRVIARDGAAVTVPAARAKDARRSNVHWLTPRSWRRWIDVGLRGYTCDGVLDRGWGGRLEDRNVAYVRLMVTSGLRRAEGGSLLTVEVPARRGDTSRYCRGRIAAEVTRAKKPRTFYAAADAVAEVETYCDSSRALAVRGAQQARRYERLKERRVVTEITRGLSPLVVWRCPDGSIVRRELNSLTVNERMTLFVEGEHGLEPLWLWLNEQGLPFQVHSWDGVFTAANRRCDTVLTPRQRLGLDPHKVYAPYATPHSARHSFALYMLVVLNSLMDQRYGLTPEDRRDFRHLYGDPWFMVQNLLGHASRETTVERYLAPVADLQLRSMLADAVDPVPAPMPELDAVFARIARESEGIQDVDDFGWTGGGT
ncbi:site-specific integrase [Mycobacterium intracellulare]|uniref:Phage integrase domain/SAM domain-containing protein n=1 Tax=Mycobacterium intracellulare subsp. chimaera TaxID=222805 RepID=A0A7U5MMN4_MYCIT|nr:site-specific integrase [Mycobacterium intracellulare]ASL10491.1 phage integrase domain/SAM domain-containing protein [Mycobacterium intracellulare subsp. chimaera]ASL12288.1 phage integrase domain/SAM domain-containing protein [Mycobacterium intracellulare subsp. chimaera]ASL16366.1 phage integrase domain/SAM domain-containing protein [Mycobacterium intracellulare subsp. chimaera]MCV7325165.1 site-specific integrase [Mycobacterium intracellulare subsp. chimaera]